MSDDLSDIGLYGLAVMGQNFALNIGSRGHKISVCNRSVEKVDTTVERAKAENVTTLRGYKDLSEFVGSIRKPRAIIILVKAGKPVESVIDQLMTVLEEGDMIIDGGNEWYENTERRAKKVGEKGLMYMGMGVSGGEDGARYGPSLMPGGPLEAYARVEHILTSAAAVSSDGTVCVTHIGKGGAGNYVKMVHNGIEYGDMQLIAEAYDLLKQIGGLNNDELSRVFEEWNNSELESYLIEITASIFKKRDDMPGGDKNEYLVDKVLDKTGQKGTGRWTVREAAEQSVAASTITAALNTRIISSMKEERVEASKLFPGPKVACIESTDEREKFVNDVKQALYASKICSYTQGMNLIRAVGIKNDWNLNLGKIASIWKGGCIIRAVFLDRITAAYDKNANLPSLFMDLEFAQELRQRENAWRRVVSVAVANGIAVPAMSASLAYFDLYRRERLPANLTQSQRDFFGRHTFQRVDDLPSKGEFVSAMWQQQD